MATERTAAASYDLLYRLLAAWVNGAAAQAGPAPGADYAALLEAARRHSLTATVGAALERAGLLGQCPPEVGRAFAQARLLNLRKTMLMDAEREKLFAFLEKQGIWYMPLKGILVKELYPEPGTREMSDNDILFDAARAGAVRRYFEQNGYTAETVGTGAHDTYNKPPLYSFEMHRMLFAHPPLPDARAEALVSYYADVAARLVPDAGGGFRRHFTDEDLYLYLLAHACKHYDRGGTGVRSLLDVWLFRRARPALDEAYLAAELEKLDMLAFERRCRALGDKIFGWPQRLAALDAEERQMLAWIEDSGTYGTMAHYTRNKLGILLPAGTALDGHAKARYLFRRLFPALEWYRTHAPFAYRHRWALPWAWAARLWDGLFTNREATRRELDALRQMDGTV